MKLQTFSVPQVHSFSELSSLEVFSLQFFELKSGVRVPSVK